MLNSDHKALLQDLSMQPVWASLLREIDDHFKRDFRYKPSDDPDTTKSADWAYYSGMDRRLEDVLKLLGYARENQDR